MVVLNFKSYSDKFLINRYLILASIFFALDLWFWHRSILYIGPGMSTLIANFQIFIIPLLSYFIFNLVPNRYQILAIFLGAVGLYLTLGYGGNFSSENIRLGLIFGILTAFAYSAYILSLKKNDLEDSARISPVISLLCISAISALILFVAVKFEGESLAYKFCSKPFFNACIRNYEPCFWLVYDYIRIKNYHCDHCWDYSHFTTYFFIGLGIFNFF